MTYIYDVMLNFNQDFYEFYEWEKDDNIYHIKRIHLMKIDSEVYNDILNNKVVLSDDILFNIFNKCEYFDNKRVLSIPYALMITDSYRVMAIMMNSCGEVIKYSSLLLEDEEDVLEVSDKLGIIKINYKIKDKKEMNNLTRNEKLIFNYIRKDLNKAYKEKDINKLKYLYYEYFNKESDDIKFIYDNLINILNDKINDKHYNLYNLIKLSIHKNV